MLQRFPLLSPGDESGDGGSIRVGDLCPRHRLRLHLTAAESECMPDEELGIDSRIEDARAVEHLDCIVEERTHGGSHRVHSVSATVSVSDRRH